MHTSEVVWTSTYRVPIPILGRLPERVGGRRMARAFDDAIRIAGELARVPHPSA